MFKLELEKYFEKTSDKISFDFNQNKGFSSEKEYNKKLYGYTESMEIYLDNSLEFNNKRLYFYDDVFYKDGRYYFIADNYMDNKFPILKEKEINIGEQNLGRYEAFGTVVNGVLDQKINILTMTVNGNKYTFNFENDISDLNYSVMIENDNTKIISKSVSSITIESVSNSIDFFVFHQDLH